MQRPALVIGSPSGDLLPLETWTATIVAPSGQLRGSAALAPGATYRETQATITLEGSAPNALHAWFVQLGECGYDRGILVGPQVYTPVMIDGQGAGRSVVMLPFTVPTSGRYFVTVRASESEASSASRVAT